MKKILILGAGFLQSFVIKRAKEMGYFVYTLDMDPNALGFKYADEYSVINITDKEKCLKYAMEKDINGVLNTANDYGVLTASFIAENLKLPGINYSLAKIIKNKSSFRKKLFAHNVDDIKQYYEITELDELNSIKENITYPVIMKPSDGSGSRGIEKVSTSSEIQKSFFKSIAESSIGSVIIEDFIEGQEIGIESIVIDGEPHILGIMDKYMTEAPYYAELGHLIPTQKNNVEKIKEIVSSAIKILGINTGAVNMDALIDRDNNISIIDIGVRMGGNLIGSHLIPKSTAYDYMGNLIKQSVNDIVEVPKKLENHIVSTRLLNLKPGKIKFIPSFEKMNSESNVTIFFNKNIGDGISEYKTNLDSCGYLVMEGEDLEKVTKTLDKLKKELDSKIGRE